MPWLQLYTVGWYYLRKNWSHSPVIEGGRGKENSASFPIVSILVKNRKNRPIHRQETRHFQIFTLGKKTVKNKELHGYFYPFKYHILYRLSMDTFLRQAQCMQNCLSTLIRFQWILPDLKDSLTIITQVSFSFLPHALEFAFQNQMENGNFFSNFVQCTQMLSDNFFNNLVK